MERRIFIQNRSLAATGGVTILNFPVFGKNAPSNKVIVAVMGVNSRGAYAPLCLPTRKTGTLLAIKKPGNYGVEAKKMAGK